MWNNPEQEAPQFPPGYQPGPQRLVFDGKRMRKPIQRKTVDYNSVIVNYVEVNINYSPNHLSFLLLLRGSSY